MAELIFEVLHCLCMANSDSGWADMFGCTWQRGAEDRCCFLRAC